MLKRILFALILAGGLTAQQQGSAQTSAPQPPADKEASPKARDYLTDAVIAGIIIAASISAYKASGRPCACPEDTMRNGRRCGGNSAWSRPGGARPLCYLTDISKVMIDTYRATKAIPALH